MDPIIEEKELIEVTRQLIRAKSVNPPADTEECANVILDILQKENIDARIIEGKKGVCNVFAKLPGKKEGKRILFNGHIDVVLPGENWTYDPFAANIDNGKIYGRGAVDMKSGVATMLAAMLAFKRSGIAFNGEILFMAVGDEETGSEFGTVHLIKKGLAEGVDYAIVTEPTNLEIKLGNRGLRWIDLCVKGESSHAGRPFLGINAVSYAARIIEAIDSMGFDVRNDQFEIPIPSFSVTQIKGGHKENVVPERCDLVLDRRMLPGETETKVLKELERIVKPLMTEERGPKIDIRFRPGYFDPFIISEDEPIARATIEAVEEITGGQVKIAGKAACTDASHLFNLAGIPTVLFGPGNEHLSHKPDEHVAVENLVTATSVYISILTKLLC
jgi:acetylornithine deacetylase/succinyl-diaminopimelate desuccinylase family protein